MSQIQYIPISRLHAHPQNPRKDLGDLTELAESIKSNGVMQNLTVTPWIGEVTGEPIEDVYRIIIGHRRKAAAKLAGLTELPCVVVEMDERQQLGTMMLENMQRSDLTAYEQAQGFQMMLDLGETVDDIAQKTGFSKSTINRRINLLELDREKFQESDARGASMWEYMELEKIKDIEKRNEVLEKAGTDNFKWSLKQALDRQATAEKLAPLIEKLSTFATEIGKGGEYVYVSYISGSTKPEDLEVPKDAREVSYYFNVDRYAGWAQLYKERIVTVEEDGAKTQREAEEAARRARVAQLEEIAERAYKLRLDFIKCVSATTIKKNLASIITASIQERMGRYSSLDEEDLSELLGIELMDSDDDDYSTEAERAIIAEAVSAAPERAFLYAAYLEFDDSGSNCHFNRWSGDHRENSSLDALYELLQKLGYKMSDEEKAMCEGTHELFITEGSDVS